ncbi:NTF2-related export protein 1/2 [Entomortierella parvispora]|uniref:Nuclear transport factor 2 n=1 Tax=Entomortierella parvispora TaxID=205924 RepID=A0A9P3M044_9FUNG|nr:NTF2-related export protein 1/2 [Entomortierella parvispora]
MDASAVAKQFVDFYYQTFDSNRQNLLPLYRPTSYLSFEGTQHAGANDIVEKLVSLPFQSVAHRVSTNDAQPTPSGEIVINVTGQLLIDGESNPQFFTQTFVLKNDGTNFYVQNDIFRLVYA